MEMKCFITIWKVRKTISIALQNKIKKSRKCDFSFLIPIVGDKISLFSFPDSGFGHKGWAQNWQEGYFGVQTKKLKVVRSTKMGPTKKCDFLWHFRIFFWSWALVFSLPISFCWRHPLLLLRFLIINPLMLNPYILDPWSLIIVTSFISDENNCWAN